MSSRTRLALVGTRDETGTCLPGTPPPGLELAWVERPANASAEALAERLRRLAPDAAIVLAPRPGEGPALAGLGLPAAGWFLGPDDTAAEWERVIAGSPQAAAGHPGLLAIQALAVADELYAPVTVPGGPPRALFAGPASERRDRFLQPAKHSYDVLHLAWGASVPELAELLGRCTVAIDLAEEPGLPVADRVGPALAAGLLVLAKRPVPAADLRAGLEVVPFAGVWELHELLGAVHRHPDAFRTVRVRGRRAAERRRASVVLPRLAAALAGPPYATWRNGSPAAISASAGAS